MALPALPQWNDTTKLQTNNQLTKHGRNKTLFLLWGGLIWDSSTNRTDDEDATIDFYHCPRCGYAYEVYSPTVEEQEDYKDFWKNER